MARSTVGCAIARPSCSPRIPIMPVRYAIVPRVGDSNHFTYQDAGFNLEKDFPALTHSAYTLRALRPGYVYVFMKGCEGERLVIHEYDGHGRYREMTYTGLENYGQREQYRSGKSLGWVWADTDPQNAREVWISYSPHLWTTAMTRQITASPALRNRHMRIIDTTELVNGEPGYSRQPHVLPASVLGEWVEDFKLEHQRVYLEWSSSHSQLYFTTFQATARHYPHAQPRAPAVVVLNDAEGIVLDLGLSVNAYQHALRDIKAPEPEPSLRPYNPLPRDKPDPTPGCFRLNVERICPASHEFHHQNLIGLLLEKTLEGFYSGDLRQLDQQVQAQAAMLEKQTAQAPLPCLLRYALLTDEKHSELGARLGQRIDLEKYRAFVIEREKLDKSIRTVREIVISAGHDHDAWLATAEKRHIDNPLGLAVALASYDRDHFHSARALETSLALIIDAMSQVLPGTEERDARFKRLEQWLDQQDSPLYMALAPFNPFKDKADAVGTLFGASDASIEVLAARFPAVANVTDLTAQAVNTVVLQRLKGKTRWDASRNLHQQVQAAVQEANAEKAKGLLMARYKITSELVKQDAFTQEVQRYLKSGMAHVEASKQVRISGSRKVTIESTTTLQVKPNLSGLSRTTSSGALNVALLWFNIINLKMAYANVKNDSAPEYTTGFASAIFAVMGGIGAVLMSARSLQMLTAAHLQALTPGTAFGSSITNFFASKLFARMTGYPAIGLGLVSDLQKSNRQYVYGDSVAASHTFNAGISTAAGSILILEGTLMLTGGTASFPLAAALILAGGTAIALGFKFYEKSTERLHSPMELWIVRSVFGTRLHDGEQRDGIRLDIEKKLPPYASRAEEIGA